ncbi:MAG: c-type cytochrome biogenesis protein CcsB [Candidatus Omnitrophica bacterium CG11_big_fil_rev_8_21_14_0_20_45_26]|uniref:C-type cytochrome biogenesis protein CcsB n=1 Tax=Candidatus Abzuiibacterium crystallinum TaxID=1974748 RepID=A0A2H0LNV2_9BACT|nr:MAG: c-type cytochrome biogenesis protein CcsB [Candidatus Omnitrophica bacterium CG11_big_fil_rev_8_21_14_0_20_45_26]PIW65303.1 MAG: c-type cytochrome biogenesis protein CcsB [Candidatus Omnitrophica bacterium CG12_big_fil_rev_8_21_14_0_65_45_16]
MTIGMLILLYLLFGILSFIAFASERKILTRSSLVLGVIIAVLHGWVILSRGLHAGRLPFTNTYETLILFAFFMTVLYLVTYRRYQLVIIGGFSGLVAAFLLALTSLLSPEIEPLLPSLKSNFLLFHVIVIFIGYAALSVAFGSAAVFLILSTVANKWLTQRRGEEKTKALLVYLDWLTYRLIAAGFPLLTFGIALGSIWANAAWGRYWNWDPKETWAFITWAVYGAYLHLRISEPFRGKAAAGFAFLGFLVLMFTYFGVNFWFSSLHAYA